MSSQSLVLKAQGLYLGFPNCPPHIQLRQFPLHVSQVAQIPQLSNSLFSASNFPSNKTDLSSKIQHLGTYSWHSPVPHLSLISSQLSNFIHFILSPKQLSTQSPPFSLLLPQFKLPLLFTSIMFTRSSNCNSRLPHSCPVFSPEDDSKTQIWFSCPSFSLSMEVTCFGKTCLIACGLDIKNVNHLWEVFLKNIKMDPT